MEESKLESTGDINEATTPMKRVLRSRIVEVDSNSSASCASNITDSTRGQLNNQIDEVKGNLCVDVIATPKKAVKEKIDLKCTLEDGKRPDLADDNQSHSSLSPVSQCGSEASNVSIRLLRNSKCVVIKLDKAVADQANSSSNKEDKSAKAILSSINEENLEEECKKDQINDKNDVDSCLDNVNEKVNDSGIVENDLKEKSKHDQITNNSEIINGSDPVINDKTVELDTPIDGNDKCEILLDNHGKSIDDGGGGGGGCNLEEDDDSLENEGRLIIEETEGNSFDTVHLEAEEPSKSVVSLLSVSNNESDTTESKEVLSEISNKDELPVTNKSLEHSVISCGNESDTTEESESTINVKNITKRKPISTYKLPEQCVEDDSSQTQSNIEKTVSDEIVNKDKTEKEIVETAIDSEKTSNHDTSVDTVILSELNEEPTLVSEECFNSERIEENCASQDCVTGNIAEDSENLSVSSRNEELPLLTKCLSKNFHRSEEQESVQESEDLELEKLIDNDSDVNLEDNTSLYFKSDKRGSAAAENIVKRSNRNKPLESDMRSKSRLNLSNVVNSLNVDKSNISEMLAQNDILDSDSEIEVSTSNVTPRRKITKHIEPVDSPVEYYGIGKDLLKGIIKEAVEGAVDEVKKELQNMKHQLSSITTMLNGMRRGKKRKFDEINAVDVDDKTHEIQSISSLSSDSSTDEPKMKLSAPTPKPSSSSPSKGMKTKDDLIKELLEGMSDHLQVPVKAKKKRKLNDLSNDSKKKKKEKKSANPIPAVKESTGLISYNNDVIRNDSVVNKKKKKKKLKLLQDNSEDMLVGGSVKNKVNDRLTLSERVMPVEDNDMDVVVKKKKKFDHDNVFKKVSHNFSDAIFDSQNFSNVQELSKKKKKGNKNKFNLLENDVAVLTSKSDYSDKTHVPSEELVTKKKKKKKNISTSVSSEIVLSPNNEVNTTRSLSNLNHNETEKKKKKKKKLNASFNFSAVGDDSPQLNVLKKKKKKQNLLSDQLSSSVTNCNGFDDVQGFESFSYGNSSNHDEQGLLKKMKSWKSKNKNQLYRATPYKDNKNKKLKLNTSMN